MERNKGITLVALIITIIIMLILVAVSVNVLIKSDLIGIAEKTTGKYKTASEEEGKGETIEIGGKKYASVDEYLKENPGKVDYIHGEDVTKELTHKSDKNVGFIFDAMPKSELFKTVILDGSLPRKTFSMGHSYDKRYYLEARKIK